MRDIASNSCTGEYVVTYLDCEWMNNISDHYYRLPLLTGWRAWFSSILKEHNAVIVIGTPCIKFETREDATAFIPKWGSNGV